MAHVITDFHGTLYKDTDEGPLWNYVAKQAIKPSEAMRHPLRTLAFAAARPELERLVAAYERGEIGYDKIYDAFNRCVLSRLSPAYVEDAIKGYADLPENTEKLDMRMLRPMLAGSNIKRGILSIGNDAFIRGILHNFDFYFQPIIANRVVLGDKGSYIDQTIYDKPDAIRRNFGVTGLGFDPNKTVYIGDNADEEPAFEYVLEHGGKVIVPFFATDAFKQYATTKYGAFVPESEQELQRFLDSVKN